jgi:hypothetical protein
MSSGEGVEIAFFDFSFFGFRVSPILSPTFPMIQGACCKHEAMPEACNNTLNLKENWDLCEDVRRADNAPLLECQVAMTKLKDILEVRSRPAFGGASRAFPGSSIQVHVGFHQHSSPCYYYYYYTLGGKL